MHEWARMNAGIDLNFIRVHQLNQRYLRAFLYFKEYNLLKGSCFCGYLKYRWRFRG